MTKNHVEFLNYYFLMDVEFAIQRIVSTKSCDPPTIWDTTKRMPSNASDDSYE